jgi:alpha-amylase
VSDVCLCFEVHQPFRVGAYDAFAVGQHHDYFDEELNSLLMRRVADKCYLPTNARLLRLIERHKGRFRVAFSISGVAVEQMRLYAPDALASFLQLVDTGDVELLVETYHHSLAALYDVDEFHAQVGLHAELMRTCFGVRPRIFRNTELIFNDQIAREVTALGFDAALVEGADDILAGRSPNGVFGAAEGPLLLLPKHYALSDDIAFRFSDPAAPAYPLTPAKYAAALHALGKEAASIHLFMDYETFGEHQWEATGIFRFLEEMPSAVLAHQDFVFRTPSEIIASKAAHDRLSFHRTVSWADSARDVSAWAGNDMQRAALKRAFHVLQQAKAHGSPETLATARRLTTSDHFYYMSTKGDADGDVHAYFRPFDSPYDAFIHFMNALSDLEGRLQPSQGSGSVGASPA